MLKNSAAMILKGRGFSCAVESPLYCHHEPANRVPDKRLFCAGWGKVQPVRDLISDFVGSLLGIDVMPAGVELATLVEERLLERNRLCEAFFAREAPGWPKPAAKCQSVSCVEAGFWPSVAVPTRQTRNTYQWNLYTP